MNKTRIIGIVVALVMAALFGTGQFDQSGQSGSGSSDQASQSEAGRSADQQRSQRTLNPAITRKDGSARRGPGPGEIALQALPGEGREIVRLIYQGGPFRYRKDGTIFQNRERLLPQRERGYYREYTVRTPGEKTRGARRIVAGGPASKPDVLYYTKDHYRSFLRIHGADQ